MSDSLSPHLDESTSLASGPLAGVRVLELATVIMGPYAGQLLGDLGADVIKVEHGAIDSSRVMGGGPDPELSGIALNLHRNKRSVGLQGTRRVYATALDVRRVDHEHPTVGARAAWFDL